MIKIETLSTHSYFFSFDI